MKLTDLIYRQKNFLTSDQCDYLINEFKKREHEKELECCPEANTGINTYSSFDMVELIPNTESFSIIHDATEKMINLYHKYTDKFNSFHVNRRDSLKYSLKYRLLRYKEGCKIHQHIDHDPYVYGSCTFNLNDDYSGGDFVFFKGKHRVKLKKGEAMIWPADFHWVHEVEKIKKGCRYSANSFLLSIPSSVYLKMSSHLQDELKIFKETDKDFTEYMIN